MALMGDPSLRLHMVYPVTQLTATQIEAMVQLNWTASVDTDIIGYNVYQADSISGQFQKLNLAIITSTTYTDSVASVMPGNVYMVRAVKSETTASGSYMNMSEGIFIAKPLVSTFTFTGDGAWSVQDNWSNNLKPPVLLPSGYTIVIDPIVTGQCTLDITQHIAAGASLVVMTGKTFVLTEDLFMH